MLAARHEIAKTSAHTNALAPKKGKCQILDQVVQAAGWNRDHARQQLVARLTQVPGLTVATVAVIDRRKNKACTYSYDARLFLYDARLFLRRVRVATGGSCGQHLAPSMGDWIEATKTEGALIPRQDC
ncbi:hypothetical protein BSZ39_13000 [Bowdeniella nasicola]|uniref:Uncharacterized protein n=1 Tax=Bowdeniella nasicola TaxID=208480 RepID=A0A1Q5PTK2_9ACTO|nr:hypothetical protein [Bowdeniella nasicola]OKL50710.1 hypothetical protein BSZ39_13000 [Bowdeniella nasicola]